MTTRRNAVDMTGSAGLISLRLAERSEAGLSKDQQKPVPLNRIRRLRSRIASWANTASFIRLRAQVFMLTLTYERIEDWRPNHINQFVRAMRASRNNGGLGKSLLGYAWVAELQKRGAVHYHVLVIATQIPPKPDMCGWWPHGMSRRERSRSGPYYLMTYARKAYQKSGLPAGARMFGMSIRPGLVDKMIALSHRMSAWPLYVRTAFLDLDRDWNVSDRPVRVRRGSSGIGGWSVCGVHVYWADYCGGEFNGRLYWDWVYTWRLWRAAVRSAARERHHVRSASRLLQDQHDRWEADLLYGEPIV